MAIQTVDQIARIQTHYLEAFDKGRFTDASRVNQTSLFAEKFENKLRTPKPKSTKYTFNYMDKGYDNGEYIALDDEADYNRSAIGAKGEVEIGFHRTHMMVNRAEPCWEGGGETEIVNYLHYETVNMYDRWYEEADRRLLQLVTAPNNGSGAGRVKPHSLTYWLTEPDANSDGAFLSSSDFSDPHPTGYSSVGGIDRTDTANEHISNWGFTYDAMSPDDGLKKLFRAMGKCKFKPYYNTSGRNATEIRPSQGYLIISDHETFIDYRQNSFGLNEGFGTDIGKFQGNSDSGVWASNEWCWAPDDAMGSGNRRVLGLNLGTWELPQYGDWFHSKDAPFELQSNPLMVVTNMYSAWTTCCKNPRLNFHAVPTL